MSNAFSGRSVSFQPNAGLIGPGLKQVSVTDAVHVLTNHLTATKTSTKRNATKQSIEASLAVADSSMTIRSID